MEVRILRFGKAGFGDRARKRRCRQGIEMKTYPAQAHTRRSGGWTITNTVGMGPK